MNKICQSTTRDNFPHHWKCIEIDGHKGCSCDSDENLRCSAYECTLADGSHRCPDGSIVAKSHLESGGVACGVRNLNSNTITAHLL